MRNSGITFINMSLFSALLLMGCNAENSNQKGSKDTVYAPINNEPVDTLRAESQGFGADTGSFSASRSGNQTASESENQTTSATDNRNTSSSNTSDGTLITSGSSLTASSSNLNVDIRLAADNLFDFNKATIKPEAEPELKKVADQLKKVNADAVQIIGHTDSKGNDQYNDKLSLQRAEAVKQWFEKNGVKNKLLASGKGEKDPIADNELPNGQDNPEGRTKNRRVDIKFVGSQSISN
ncbi:OmpA family protein [Sphingobacterium sp. CZ-2]|nr:OmpA family protein [Sphingobacterium sp. CZ-2]QBR11981.1 OmpA family protein [Sphingobacterium sp. CZ-2]